MYEKDFPIYSLDFIKHNKHWISYYGYGGLSPYYAEDPRTGLTIPNCVPMVYGYWHCMGDCKEPKELKLCPGNACYFYPYNDGYERSETIPKVGSISCWNGGPDGYGHVAIVKWVSKDKKRIKTINSAYKSTIYYERTLDYPFNFGSYRHQGFIYCPFVEDNPPIEHKFEIGDKVVITGDLYKSSMAESASGYIKDKVTYITRYAEGSLHPYNTSGDLGWMNEDAIEKYDGEVLKVGDKVEPITNKQYNGRYAVRWDEYYYITEISGDRAVLAAKRGNRLVTWCAMNVNNLRKVG